MLRVTSGAGAVLTGLSMLIVLLIGAVFSPGGALLTTFALAPLLFLVLTLMTFARAKSLRARTTLDLEQAQTAALVKLLTEFPEGALASQLASLLQISHSRAEQLLTRLNVRDDIQSMIADDGQLLFRLRGSHDASTDPFAPPRAGRLRLATDDSASPGADPEHEVSSAGEETAEQVQQPEKASTKGAR